MSGSLEEKSVVEARFRKLSREQVCCRDVYKYRIETLYFEKTEMRSGAKNQVLQKVVFLQLKKVCAVGLRQF